MLLKEFNSVIYVHSFSPAFLAAMRFVSNRSEIDKNNQATGLQMTGFTSSSSKNFTLYGLASEFLEGKMSALIVGIYKALMPIAFRLSCQTCYSK